MLIHNKNDIEFVTEFQCFLGQPVPEHLIYNDAFFILLYIRFFSAFYYKVLDN